MIQPVGSRARIGVRTKSGSGTRTRAGSGTSTRRSLVRTTSYVLTIE